MIFEVSCRSRPAATAAQPQTRSWEKFPASGNSSPNCVASRELHRGYADVGYDFVSALLVDPQGFDAGDSNLYRYVNNAPTNATDPSGLLLYVAGSDATKAFQKELADIGIETTVIDAFGGPPWTSGWVLANDPAKVQKLIDGGKVAGFLLENLKAMLSPGTNRIIGRKGLFDSSLAEWTNGGATDTLKRAAKTGVTQFIAAGVRNNLPTETIAKIVTAAYKASAGFTIDPCLAWVNSFANVLSEALGTKSFAPVQGTGIQGTIVSFDISFLLSASTLFLSDSHSAFRMTFKDGSVFYFDIGSLGRGPITPGSQINRNDFFNEK